MAGAFTAREEVGVQEPSDALVNTQDLGLCDLDNLDVTLENPDGKTYVNGDETVEWITDTLVSDTDAGIWIYADSGTWTEIDEKIADDGSELWNTTMIEDGEALAYVWVRDKITNCYQYAWNDYTFIVDNSRPADVSFVEPGSGEVLTGEQTVTWDRVEDNPLDADLAVSLDGGSSWKTIGSFADDGAVSWNTEEYNGSDDAKLKLTLTDEVDQQTTIQSDTFALDHTPPSTSICGPAAGDVVHGEVELCWSTDDAHPDDVRLEISDDGGSSWTTIAVSATDDGSYAWDSTAWPDGDRYRVRVVPTDAAGNVGGAVTTGEFALDNSGPTLAVDAPADGATVATVSEIEGSVSDMTGVSDLQVTLHRTDDDMYWSAGAASWRDEPVSNDVEPGSSWTMTDLPSDLDPGRYEIRARASDVLGSTTEIVTGFEVERADDDDTDDGNATGQTPGSDPPATTTSTSSTGGVPADPDCGRWSCDRVLDAVANPGSAVMTPEGGGGQVGDLCNRIPDACGEVEKTTKYGCGSFRTESPVVLSGRRVTVAPRLICGIAGGLTNNACEFLSVEGQMFWLRFFGPEPVEKVTVGAGASGPAKLTDPAERKAMQQCKDKLHPTLSGVAGWFENEGCTGDWIERKLSGRTGKRNHSRTVKLGGTAQAISVDWSDYLHGRILCYHEEDGLPQHVPSPTSAFGPEVEVCNDSTFRVEWKPRWWDEEVQPDQARIAFQVPNRCLADDGQPRLLHYNTTTSSGNDSEDGHNVTLEGSDPRTDDGEEKTVVEGEWEALEVETVERKDGHTLFAATTSSFSPFAFATVDSDDGDEDPSARISASCTELDCTLDASGSSDPDGTVSSYRWTLGDGTTRNGSTIRHTYAEPGDYEVQLTVVDGAGNRDTRTTVVAPRPGNRGPTADFQARCDGRTCTLNASASRDPDGRIQAYDWDLDDGHVAKGEHLTYTFDAAGSYSVRLVVRDGNGSTGTTTRTVSLEPAEPGSDAGDGVGATDRDGAETGTGPRIGGSVLDWLAGLIGFLLEYPLVGLLLGILFVECGLIGWGLQRRRRRS